MNYKLHYINNEMKGFYTDEIHGENIPNPNILISEDLWQELLKKEYQFKDYRKLPKKLIFELEDIILFKEVVREALEHKPTEVEKRIEILEGENADLLIDSAVKDSKIQMLENDLADIMLEIASMNSGGLK